MKTKEELEDRLSALKGGDTVLARMCIFIKRDDGRWHIPDGRKGITVYQDTIVDLMLDAQAKGRYWTIYSELGEETE